MYIAAGHNIFAFAEADNPSFIVMLAWPASPKRLRRLNPASFFGMIPDEPE